MVLDTNPRTHRRIFKALRLLMKILFLYTLKSVIAL